MSSVSRRNLLRGGTAAALGLGLGLRFGASSSAQDAATPTVAGLQDQGALADLRQRLGGTLILPGDALYEPQSHPSNGRYRHIRPVAIAQVADERDIATSLAWCRENGVPLVGRGGGHSYAGYSTTEGLTIDLSKLNTVIFDPVAGTAIIGGGAVNRDYFNLTADGPWFLPGGTCLGVGVGGLTLGGGIGYNTHWAGLTCDHLRSSRIVTADSEVLEIDEENHPDLFWACRGGAGGNFGINTSFTYDLAPAHQDNVTFYRFDYRGADAAAAVFSAFHTMLQGAPAALNAVAQAQAVELGDGGPREAISVFTRGQYIGPIRELLDLLGPVLAAAKPTQAVVQEMAFWDMQRQFVSEEATWHSYGDHSRYAAEPLPDSAISAMVDLLAACPSRSDATNGSIWSLGWVGGDVVGSVGRTETAYVHRDMLTLLRPTPVWDNDASEDVAADLIAWTEEVIAAIAPHTPNESYQNFPNRIIDDWQEAYYAENFPRLVEVKTAYDPGKVFNNPQSIPPA